MAENKTRFPEFVGPSNTLRVERFDNQRTVNMYLEKDPLGSGKGGEPYALVGTPGLKILAGLPSGIGTGPIRAVYSVSLNNAVYVVSGAEIYKLDSNLDDPVLVGPMLTSTGFVSIADNGNSGNEIVFVDGQYGYYSNLIGIPTLTNIIDPNFYPASTVSYQDGYFIFCQTGTSYYFISDLYSVNFLPLNQANKAGDSDVLIATICNNRILYLLGQNTIETWWDSGQSGSTPFARQDGQFAQTGCTAVGSVTRIFNTIMWLGTNPQGGGIVYMMENSQPIRVSNHAIEYSLQNAGDLSGSTAYSWQIEGHYFYVLNVPGLNTTWVYDIATQQWFEQQSVRNGKVGKHLGGCHTFYNGTHLIGDQNSNLVYEYDFDTYTDNTQPIERLRQSPHISQGLNRIFYKLFQVDTSPGVGLADGTDPRITLTISNDGGETWGNPIFASLGKQGKYFTRARWQRLGSSRDRVFRVTCSDPVKFNLLSAYLDVEAGEA